MLQNHIKIAWRNLLFHRSTSVINLAGLTVGMTAAFLIFIWVKNEHSYDSYHPDAKNIYRFTTGNEKDPARGEERTPYLIAEDFKNKIPGIEIMTRLYPLAIAAPVVDVGNALFKEKDAAYVDNNWFRMFSFKFIRGNAESFSNAPNSIVLSESDAIKYFGHDNPVGRVLKVNGNNCIIQGVISDHASNSSFRYKMFLSEALRPVNPRLRQFMRIADGYQTYVRLSSGVLPAKAGQQATIIYSHLLKEPNTVTLIPLTAIHFEHLGQSFLRHGDRDLTNIMFILGIVLLAIACINYVNLTTAKASVRVKEVSVKKIVGAGKLHLFAQFIIESAMISCIALAITLLLVQLFLPTFNRFTDNNFSLSLADPSLWTVLLGTSIFSLLMSSIYPALLLSSLEPLSLIAKSRDQNWGVTALRKSLVILQFSVSITLITATVIIYKQMQFINSQYSTYDKSTVFSFLFNTNLQGPAKKSQLDAVKQSLLSFNSIENVSSMGGDAILNIPNSWSGFDWAGRNKTLEANINFMPIGSTINDITKLNLQSGRWFDSKRAEDEKNFILNETAVKELGIQQPVIGHRFSLDQDTGTVIGVVKDFHYLDIRSKIGALVIGNNPMYTNALLVKTTPGKQSDALIAAEKVFKQFSPDQPFDYHFASDEFNEVYRTDQKSATLIWVFSGLAIFISCLGLFGLAAFSAERRKKEIGIRKVLGASVKGLVQLLSSDFIKLVCIAMIIAFPVTLWGMQKWLQNFAYRIEIQWWMFALAGGLAIVIAFITVSSQAIKTALANPVKSLRNE
jgi:putative ABC transport system permease protein